ncbi:MAG: hypothetical protein AAF389_03740 [Gemmatimonadota bacterium]
MSDDRLQVLSDDDAEDAAAVDERVVQLSTALAEVEALAELDVDVDTESAGGRMLVPVEAVAPLVTAIVDAMGATTPSPADEGLAAAQRREALRAEAADEARARYRLSRVGSGAVATLVTTLWLLPQLVAAFAGEAAVAVFQTSILAPLFVWPLFDAVAFGVGLYAWLFFSLTWVMEQNDLRRIDGVTTDAARARLLHRAVLRARQRGDQDSITKADMRDALGRGLRPTFALRLLGARDVSASFLDRVTTVHIEELSAQGVLAPSTQASLSPRYLVAEAVSRDLQP